MAEVSTASPELSRLVTGVARALAAAARSWALYPPEHPAATASLARLQTALVEATRGGPLVVGVTPETLVIETTASPAPRPRAATAGPVGEAAALLHQRDILKVGLQQDIDLPTLQAFLALLVEDANAVRARGGPAAVWRSGGHAGIVLEQIDYQRVLADREPKAAAARKDDLWTSIVRAVLDRRKALDEAAQQRLLEIAGDADAIGELAEDVMAPACTADGSPLVTTQAATVVAAYRHLSNIVSVMAPDRQSEVFQNLAIATSRLDPKVVVQILRTEEGPMAAGAASVVRGVAAAFDDLKVAQLMATTLALEGQASTRLADVFETIAPDEARKRRVLTLTRSLLQETDFGRRTEFETLWTSMEELLMTYNERPFVGEQYRAGLDQAGARAAAMAASDLPEELPVWLETLGQDNVRRLSVRLLIDLLNLEEEAARVHALASDVGALAEDLLMAGDYASAATVAGALARKAATPGLLRDACRVALDQLGESPALCETVAMLDDLDDAQLGHVRAFCTHVGPPSAEALKTALQQEDSRAPRALQRATDILVGFGAPVVGRLAALTSSPKWHVQRNACLILERIGAPEAVPLLQPLLRGVDPRVTTHAVRALSNIDDPAAARAVHTVLRAATGDARQAVVSALVTERDPRVVPVLVRILNESDPLGGDHAVVIETLGAIAVLGGVGDPTVGAVSAVLRRKRLFARRKVAALRQAGLATLRKIGTASADAAVREAAENGDRMLRKLARAM
jgi:hypothetical protein